MAFVLSQKVLFKHCDPAGIVFYPRYFEMMNDAVEAYFERIVGMPFEALHRTHAVPTVAIATEFRAPSRHGDALDLTVVPTRVGATSAALTVVATCGGELRFETRQTIVHIDKATMRPARWPDAARAALTADAAPDPSDPTQGDVP
jgi:4-hydroxybenzoyl-CoA thioesterase